MIFNKYTETSFYGLFGFSGKASIVCTITTEITFSRLSDKGKIKALEMGFSPAISLPNSVDTEELENLNLRNFLENLANSDLWLAIAGETAQPIVAILWSEPFFV
jgi:hypothetical protein